MDVSLHSDQILREYVGLCWWKTFLSTVAFACGCDVLHIFLLVNACHITTVKYAVDILQHLLVDDLSVAEQETDGFVL